VKRLAFALALAALGSFVACPMEPRDRPDIACADACKKTIFACTPHECDRGCAFVLDRLVEREQRTVLGCMERAPKCGDAEWADCAVKVGAHADGGPGVPPELPSEF
jgi:hypothetical protein